MKKTLLIKILSATKGAFLNKGFLFCFLLCFILNSQFSILNCSAQSHTVYECNFDNWTDGKPDGWSFPTFPPNITISQYTPAFSGLYACKVEHPTYPGVSMTSTETFPIYWGKKYILSFAAKMTIGTKLDFYIQYLGNPDEYSPIITLRGYYVKTIDVDTVWKEYEIEFVPICHDVNSAPNTTPRSSLYNALRISANISLPRSYGFVIDHIKLVAKDRTMEFDYLETNNIKTYIDPIAPFMNTPPFQINYFEAPKNSKKSTIFNSNLWMGGLNSGNLHLAAQLYCQFGRDFWLGPVSTDYEVINEESVVSDAYREKYHHTWKVSKAEIAYHRAHYADAGYVMPWAIAHWPAHGRTEYGESAQLAPYKNVAGTSAYEPELGDYPLIRGDEAVFFITNDALEEHTESGGTPLNVDILGMAYAFNAPDSMLQNTIFLSYDIRNRSTNTYHDFYFGFKTDFDIGYALDDYIGCDTSLNLMYGYNGTEIDGNGGSWAYGENPPVQGVMFLNQKMSAFLYHNNDGQVHGDPRNASDYYNYLRAIWKDGTPVTYGGNGYNPGSTDYTNFMFSGDPINKTGWTEFTPNGPGSEPNDPADRRGVMSTGPFTLNAGESITIDLALPFARDYGSKNGNLASLAKLKQFTQEVQEYYDENIVGIAETLRATSLRVYPNPSNGQFTIESEKIIESIEVYNLLGKKIFESTPKSQTTQINTRLPQGLYMYRAVMGDHSICSGKIVVL